MRLGALAQVAQVAQVALTMLVLKSATARHCSSKAEFSDGRILPPIVVAQVALTMLVLEFATARHCSSKAKQNPLFKKQNQNTDKLLMTGWGLSGINGKNRQNVLFNSRKIGLQY